MENKHGVQVSIMIYKIMGISRKEKKEKSLKPKYKAVFF